MNNRCFIVVFLLFLSQVVFGQLRNLYVFEDNIIRQITFRFINDTTLKVANKEDATGTRRKTHICFTDEYRVTWIDKHHAILQLQSTDREDYRINKKTIPPVHMNDPKKAKYSRQIFPILNNEVIALSFDYSMLYVNPFILYSQEKPNWQTSTCNVCPVLFAKLGQRNYSDKLNYHYSDRAERNLTFQFLDNKTIRISNSDLTVNGKSQNNGFSFVDIYCIEPNNNLCSYRITKLISTTRQDYPKSSLCPPLSNDCIGNTSNVLPILENENIYFSLNYVLLQLGPFTFRYTGDLEPLGSLGPSIDAYPYRCKSFILTSAF